MSPRTSDAPGGRALALAVSGTGVVALFLASRVFLGNGADTASAEDATPHALGARVATASSTTATPGPTSSTSTSSGRDPFAALAPSGAAARAGATSSPTTGSAAHVTASPTPASRTGSGVGVGLGGGGTGTGASGTGASGTGASGTGASGTGASGTGAALQPGTTSARPTASPTNVPTPVALTVVQLDSVAADDSSAVLTVNGRDETVAPSATFAKGAYTLLRLEAGSCATVGLTSAVATAAGTTAAAGASGAAAVSTAAAAASGTSPLLTLDVQDLCVGNAVSLPRG